MNKVDQSYSSNMVLELWRINLLLQHTIPDSLEVRDGFCRRPLPLPQLPTLRSLLLAEAVTMLDKL